MFSNKANFPATESRDTLNTYCNLHVIYCLKSWENFERQGKRYSHLGTLIGVFNHGFKKCSGFQSSTSVCRLHIFESDHTTPSSSNLLSTERFNCGQWSSSVCETWPSSSLFAFLTASPGSVLFNVSNLLARIGSV